MLLACGTETYPGSPCPQLAVRNRANPRKLLVRVGPADAQVLAGQHAVAAHEVVARVVVQRADDGELVRHLRLLGEQLGDVEPGHPRADRLPDAGVLLRGVRLHVIKVHVPRPAVEPDQNDRRVLAAVLARLLLGPQDFRQRHARHAGNAELEKAPPAHAVAVFARFAEIDAKHSVAPLKVRGSTVLASSSRQPNLCQS